MLRLLLPCLALAALTSLALADDTKPAPQRVLRHATWLGVPDASGHQTQSSGLVESDVSPWELMDQTGYHVKLSAWKGDTLVSESELEVLAGMTGVMRCGAGSVPLGPGGQPAAAVQRLVSLVAIDSIGVPFPGVPPTTFTSQEQAALAVAQRIVFGNLTVRMYMPNADHFELRLFSQAIPAARLQWEEGTALPVMEFPDRPAEVELGTVAGRIDTPDLGLEVPSNAWAGLVPVASADGIVLQRPAP